MKKLLTILALGLALGCHAEPLAWKANSLTLTNAPGDYVFSVHGTTNALRIGTNDTITVSHGTNVYTALTTNLTVIRPGLTTNTLVFKSGILTGVQ